MTESKRSATTPSTSAPTPQTTRFFDVTSIRRDAQIAVVYRDRTACAQTIASLVRALAFKTVLATCGSNGARKTLAALDVGHATCEFITPDALDRRPAVKDTVEVVHDHHYDESVMRQLAHRRPSARIITCIDPRQLDGNGTEYLFVERDIGVDIGVGSGVNIGVGVGVGVDSTSLASNLLSRDHWRAVQMAATALPTDESPGYIVVDRTRIDGSGDGQRSSPAGGGDASALPRLWWWNSNSPISVSTRSIVALLDTAPSSSSSSSSS
jgi:hypothetical protein